MDRRLMREANRAHRQENRAERKESRLHAQAANAAMRGNIGLAINKEMRAQRQGAVADRAHAREVAVTGAMVTHATSCHHGIRQPCHHGCTSHNHTTHYAHHGHGQMPTCPPAVGVVTVVPPTMPQYGPQYGITHATITTYQGAPPVYTPYPTGQIPHPQAATYGFCTP